MNVLERQQRLQRDLGIPGENEIPVRVGGHHRSKQVDIDPLVEGSHHEQPGSVHVRERIRADPRPLEHAVIDGVRNPERISSTRERAVEVRSRGCYAEVGGLDGARLSSSPRSSPFIPGRET